jgi:UDP-N-acetylmuramate: L-alanyl-gamma-D-glutamyl-meso-diaminopimelate ligase
MRVHVIGVAGAGMAPLAGLLVAAGHEVTGSDVAFDPPMGPRLEAWGVGTRRGTDPTILDELAPDLVVVGNVCRRDHPLAVHAEARGIRRVSLPTALRELVFGPRPVVAACGTHGKTTTTALLARIFADAGVEPGYLVGGIPVASSGRANSVASSGRANSVASSAEPFALGRTARALTGLPLAPFVIEGDEYDSAFFEKQPKVWGYAPKVAILTSIEHDHVDVYPTEASYLAAFRGLLDRLPSEDDGGLLVANAADARVRALVSEASPRARVVWYAASDASGRPFPDGDLGDLLPSWSAHEIALGGDDDEIQPFELFGGPSFVGRYALSVFGVHNVGNAVAALAAAVEGFGLPVREIAARLPAFRGTERRLERLADRPALYDDFAHHPTAVEATLQAARARHRKARLIALYEPRSATACRAIHQEAYARAFAPADVIVLAPLGRSTIPEGERLDLDRLERALALAGKEVHRPPLEEIVPLVRRIAREADAIVSMSNGAFAGIPHTLARAFGPAARAR